jgi:hypothetical protein
MGRITFNNPGIGLRSIKMGHETIFKHVLASLEMLLTLQAKDD